MFINDVQPTAIHLPADTGVAMPQLTHVGMTLTLLAGIVVQPITAGELSSCSPFRFSAFEFARGPLLSACHIVESADVDGDGQKEFVVASEDSLYVLENDGAAGFTVAATYNLNVGISDFALGDVDGDADIDIVLVNWFYDSNHHFAVLRNAGDGTYGAPEIYLTAMEPTSVSLGDMDGDHRPELGVAGNSGIVCVYQNDGAGNYGAIPQCVQGPHSQHVELADLNSDGLADLIAMRLVGESNVIVALNDGTGNLSEPVEYYGGVWPQDLEVADLHDDGHPDLILAVGEQVWVMRNLGDGAFQFPVVFEAGLRLTALTCGDLDGDGDTDIATVGRDDGVCSTILNDGNGFFAAPSVYRGNKNATGITLDDFNADGVLDGVVANPENGTVGVYFNDGQGNLGRAVSLDAETNLNDMIVGDFDSDNDDDVLLIGSSPELLLMENQGDGTFVAREENWATAFHADAADLDGDGDLEVVLTDRSNAVVHIVQHVGNGQFSVQQQIELAGGFRHDLAIRDLNEDGLLDIVVSSPFSDEVQALLNLGNGVFDSAVVTDIGNPIDGMLVTHLNADPFADLVMVWNDLRRLIVYFGDGQGGFTPSATIDTPEGPLRLEHADFDGDGDEDVVMSSDEGHVPVQLYMNDGTGSLQLHDTLSPPVFGGANVQSLTIADFNHDGAVDLSVSVNIYLNDGAGNLTLTTAPPFFPSDFPISTAAGDFDLDGAIDFAAASNGDQFVVVFGQCASDACPADLDDGGAVDVFDLLELLSGWGGPGPGAMLAEPTDTVNVLDLLEMLSQWGTCS